MKLPFITEQLIDEAAEKMGEKIFYQNTLAAMQARQPILFSYLLSENFHLLTNQEKEYLFYLSLVIFECTSSYYPKDWEVFSSEQIEQAEDKNWHILNESDARRFRDKLDAFFENYPQEDLLAFVEDSLVIDEEDNLVTKEGRELLFTGLKTLIDLLCGIRN